MCSKLFLKNRHITLPVFFLGKFERKHIFCLFVPFLETIGQGPAHTNKKEYITLKKIINKIFETVKSKEVYK